MANTHSLTKPFNFTKAGQKHKWTGASRTILKIPVVSFLVYVRFKVAWETKVSIWFSEWWIDGDCCWVKFWVIFLQKKQIFKWIWASRLCQFNWTVEVDVTLRNQKLSQVTNWLPNCLSSENLRRAYRYLGFHNTFSVLQECVKLVA